MNKIERFYKDGMLQKVPKKLKAKLEVFEETMKLFKKGRVYSEKEVNEILKKIFLDYAMLRRYLIDFKYLERSKDGREYSVKKSSENIEN